jgi:hypothetical protein
MDFGYRHIVTFAPGNRGEVNEPNAQVYDDGKVYFYAVEPDDLDAFSIWVERIFGGDAEIERFENRFYVN